MKTILITLAIAFSSVGHANTTVTVAPMGTIQIKPGQSHRTSGGEIVNCVEAECTITHKYVSGKFQLMTPNGKLHFESESKDEVLRKSKDLVDLRVCDRLRIDTDK